MSLVIIRKTAPTAEWLSALAQACPGLDVRVWPDTGPVEEVEFVLTWAAAPGVIAAFPNLRAIFSLGAGVDHILNDPTVPPHLPIARMIDPALTHGMVQYVVLAVLQYVRDWDGMREAARAAQWRRPAQRPARIGIMGMGELGSACARALLGMGFDVAGWSRSAKQLPGVEAYAGDGLDAFLARTDVLVCLLPLTQELDGVLCRSLFDKLPVGAYLVNVGRGEHLVEADLLEAIGRGQLSGATLDVFRQEPLPREHPFWRCPQIAVTPHLASMTRPESAVRHVAANIVRARAGQPLAGQVSREQGY